MDELLIEILAEEGGEHDFTFAKLSQELQDKIATMVPMEIVESAKNCLQELINYLSHVPGEPWKEAYC